MNGVPDNDLELLEAWLDDALSASDVQRVGQRLASEPELAAEMARLRVERAARLAVWQSMTPGETDAKRFAARPEE